METVFQDLRYAVRSLVKSPAFALISTATLTLAIAVNTAIFSLVNVVVFSDLPMKNSEAMTVIRLNNGPLGVEDEALSLPELVDYREQCRSFVGLVARKPDQWVLTGGSEPLRVDGYRITDNFLDVWGIGTVAGRGFFSGEDQPGSQPVAILSHGFWTRHFGAASKVVGSSIRLDGRDHTVIGILSPQIEFGSLAEAEVWLPLGLDLSNTSRDQRDLSVTGRLRPGVSVDQAGQEMAVIGARVAEEHPDTNRGWGPHVMGVRKRSSTTRTRSSSSSSC